MQHQSIRRRAWLGAASVAVMVALSGCAEFWAARDLRAKGWRDARVVQVDSGASTIENLDKDCRRVLSANGAATVRYAIYQFRGVGRSRWHLIAPLQEDALPQVGDLVRVNVKDCSLAPIPQ